MDGNNGRCREQQQQQQQEQKDIANIVKFRMIYFDRLRFEGGWWNAWEICERHSAFDWDISSLSLKKNKNTTKTLKKTKTFHLLSDGNLLKCDAQQLKEWRGMHCILQRDHRKGLDQIV